MDKASTFSRALVLHTGKPPRKHFTSLLSPHVSVTTTTFPVLFNFYPVSLQRKKLASLRVLNVKFVKFVLPQDNICMQL